MSDEEETEGNETNRDCIGTRSHKRCNANFCSLAGTEQRDCMGWETGIHVKHCPKSHTRTTERKPRDPFGLAAFSQEDRDEAARVIEGLLQRHAR